MMKPPKAMSEQEQREGALRRLEKLAAVGQEISTIAHEISSPLESLTNLLYLIQVSDSMEEIQRYAGIAQQELARVAEITARTLRSHRQPSKPTRIDLGELAQSVVAPYATRMLLRNIQVEFRLREAPNVLCLEGEIRQVLNNLVRNALDAMSGLDARGRLLIRVAKACTPQNAEGDGWAPRAGVRVTIADTGEGISPEMEDRLFGLFQTTKELMGTGLGLWVSRGIVERHGGRIRVRSRRGAKSWTVFGVWLPVDGGAGLTNLL